MSESSANGGIGVLGLLQVILIVLKIVDVIKFSWWLVFVPTFLSIVIFILAIVVLVWVAKNKWREE